MIGWSDDHPRKHITACDVIACVTGDAPLLSFLASQNDSDDQLFSTRESAVARVSAHFRLSVNVLVAWAIPCELSSLVVIRLVLFLLLLYFIKSALG